ncbi:mechanosensitive ion channel family protein [Pontivivens ytuae]|uniref:Small-conductance mechanosensitive channel n=1 Tax=Pontivivens ytuae TaxID=2789856 RepID=A0A7S9LSS5_9RHOB|nr:mechanosensitive ion channel family protein [Pontivivens ytuae]QPH54491.1 mechanosensitive ion channel family protein [Pontivivens ytuae]
MDETGFLSLMMTEIETYAAGVVEAAPRIAAAVLVILLTWIIVRLVRWIVSRVTQRARMRRNLRDVLMMLSGIAIWVVGLLISSTILFPSVTPGRALTTLGLGSVAVGFAFKDVFENFLAGLLILLREPFKIGDHIWSDEAGIEGQVEDITIRDTRIRQTDGQLAVMPNAQLFQNPVVVRTDTELRRTSIICGVAYGEDVDAARDVILEAVRNVDSVRNDVRDVQVFAQAFGASSIDFEIAWWTGSRPLDIRASRDQVVAAVKRALDEAGIEIPFPYRTLTFKADSPVPLPEARNEAEAPSTA